jgi:hypothetical protein
MCINLQHKFNINLNLFGCMICLSVQTAFEAPPGMTVTNQNEVHDEIENRLNLRNACYHSIQNVLSSHVISNKTGYV